eukprot:371537-Prymnesium_polylepis.2
MPGGSASLLSQHAQLKKTRPSGSVTSLRVAAAGKSTKKFSVLAPGTPLGSVDHAPPLARTTTSPCAPTKLPPSQINFLAKRLPVGLSASSPG